VNLIHLKEKGKFKMNKKGGIIAYFFWISFGIVIGMFIGFQFALSFACK